MGLSDPTSSAPRKCRLCPATILFLPNKATGATLPGQRIKTIYRKTDAGEFEKVEIEGELYVSHFETCPNPSAFSRGGSGSSR